MLKGQLLFEEGNIEKSKEHLIKILNILKKEESKYIMSDVYLKISDVYEEMKDYEKVLEYTNKVYDLKKTEEDEQTLNSLFKIIEINTLIGDFETANQYCKIALTISIKKKNKDYEHKVLRLYSDIYKQKGDKESAIQYLLKSLEIVKDLEYKQTMGNIYINLGELYSDISPDKKLEFYQKGVEIYKDLKII